MYTLPVLTVFLIAAYDQQNFKSSVTQCEEWLANTVCIVDRLNGLNFIQVQQRLRMANNHNCDLNREAKKDK